MPIFNVSTAGYKGPKFVSYIQLGLIRLLPDYEDIEIMPEDYRQIAKRRHGECSAISAKLAKRLGFFSYMNWITVLVPLILAGGAGSAFFAGNNWASWIGATALLGALLTAIHKGLNCDAHQSECRRLIQSYGGLAARYRTLHEIDKKDGESRLLELEETLANLRESETISNLRSIKAANTDS